MGLESIGAAFATLLAEKAAVTTAAALASEGAAVTAGLTSAGATAAGATALETGAAATAGLSLTEGATAASLTPLADITVGGISASQVPSSLATGGSGLGSYLTAGNISKAATVGSFGTNVLGSMEQRELIAKQSKAEKQRALAQSRMASLQERNARMGLIKEARIKKAANVAAGQTAVGGDASALSGLSALSGTQGSLQTQLGTNISQMGQYSTLQDMSNQADYDIYNATTTAKQNISTLAGIDTIFKGLKDIYGA